MNEKVLRYSKFVMGLGIVVAVVFAIPAIILGLRQEYVATCIFLLFVLLGLFLIYAYQKECVILREEDFEFRKAFRKPKRIRYDEVQCILLIKLSSKVSTVLVGKQYQRLEGVEDTLIDMRPLFDALVAHDVPMEDFEALYASGQDTSMYWPAMNWIERSNYKNIAQESQNVDAMKQALDPAQIEAGKARLRVLGWAMVAACAASYFIGGKPGYILLIAVLLMAYGIYLWYYPFISVESVSKKGKEQALQAPFLGPALAFLLLIRFTMNNSFDYIVFFGYVAAFAAILLIPFVVKSVRTDIPQSWGRKMAVVLAIAGMAFVTVLPVNYLFTFEPATHENIVITKKHTSGGRSISYELSGEWRGEETTFDTRLDVFKNTKVGDTRRVCIRRSVFGFEYYSIHL